MAEIQYDDAGRIISLKIKNDDSGEIVYPSPSHGTKAKVQTAGPDRDAIRKEVLQTAQMMGMSPSQVAQQYKLNANSTVEQLVGVLEALRQRGVA